MSKINTLFVILISGITISCFVLSHDMATKKAEAFSPTSEHNPLSNLDGNADQQDPKEQDQSKTKPIKREPYKPLSDKELRKKLTKLQYEVTQKEATERPWTNKFDKHFKEGIYVCIISGEPLFSSKDKYDSGCGWPAFTKPINQNEFESRTDYKLGYARTEVRAKTANSHLGHVFSDGPKSEGGLRFCINSASLRFVPKEKLSEEGYGEYAYLFEDTKKKQDKKNGTGKSDKPDSDAP